MSDLPSGYTERLNLREQITRIDRAIAETGKLQAEAAKFRRERFLTPVVAASALGGFIAALLPNLLRAWWSN